MLRISRKSFFLWLLLGREERWAGWLLVLLVATVDCGRRWRSAATVLVADVLGTSMSKRSPEREKLDEKGANNRLNSAKGVWAPRG